MNIDGTNWLACTRFASETPDHATIYPLNNLPVIKDLVPDLKHVFAQYSLIEPWLKAKPSRNGFSRPKSVANSMAIGNAFSAPAARQAARVTGGTPIDSSALPFCFKPGDGWWTAAMRRLESGWMISKIRSGCIGATPFSIAPAPAQRG